MFTDAELDLLLADDGVPVVVGAESAVGIFNSQDLVMDDGSGAGQVVLTHPTVLVKASALPSAARHLTATVNGTSYVIRDIRSESHDQMKRLYLGVTTP